jgi:hypothetical protein
MPNPNHERLDEELKTIALTAQGHPPGSPERQKHLGQLITKIQKSAQKVRPMCPPSCEGSYSEIYNIALQTTYQYICEEIDQYRIERGTVMAWFNFNLSKQFIQATREIMNPGKSRNWSRIKRISLDDLDRGETIEETGQVESSLSERVLEVIREDPEGLFRAEIMPSNPRVNFQWLVLQRIAGYHWREIAEDKGSTIQGLNNFCDRSLKKFKDKIKKYL